MFNTRDTTKVFDLVGRATAAGDVTLVAIDGLGGAGKSTLAAQLIVSLQEAAIVALDDFYRPMPAAERAELGPQDGYERYFDWRRLRDHVLAPLTEGTPARYRRYEWATNSLAEWREVEPSGVVLIEGVYSTRPQLRPYYGATVYVHTPREDRIARMLDRDYEDVSWVQHWMAVEDWYLENERPGEHVDLVVNGY